MERVEYVGRIADIGEFVPVLAADRLDALRQFSDVALDALYMEAASKDAVFEHNSAYSHHLVKLRDGQFFALENDVKPSFDKEDVEKLYVGVPLTG
ncbi:hypothetical protein [Alicyclobacillus acidoterrestris]|uniref:Uncharacterized protein n=1 Tax=Alicyclobacillus acidoterrestris (strain ATCC 49025 / DSM 3922 / CIP 106132 / NCIMB 13137 / GD3B) TaxID=1356854 RepID=T0BFV1_ALIAG|nr:hypothetical protein [Alicyclobacillus acidoterrestris]EPZ42888.1 hypothetical protein N007_13880 [Alicyclobacillus acidoterrestris ATCC 49025]UNO50092.1 hypothetical protein K1I37_06280 [Alicyclobacillus acidoterrestris]